MFHRSDQEGHRDGAPEAQLINRLGWRLVRGLTELGLALMVLAVLITANMAAGRLLPVLDLTKDRLYTLSPQTEQLLAGLQTDIKVLVFIEEGSTLGNDVRSLLEEYQRASSRVRFEFVVPSLRPAVAQRYGITDTAMMVVTAGERSRQMPISVLFSQGDHPDGVEFTGEQSLDQAILELTRGKVKPILFLTGHGEPDPDEKLPDLVASLKRELYDVDTLNLGRGPIPSDAAVLIMAGPQKDLTPGEVEMLDQWVRDGGRLMVLLDPAPQGTFPELIGFLARWGVRVHDDTVVDPDRALFTDQTSPVARLDWHILTEALIVRNLSVGLPSARSMVAENAPAGYAVESVFGTGESAWGERDYGVEPKKDPSDYQVPFSMAMTVSVNGQGDSPEQPRLLVVGSSGFLFPPMAQFQGNTDFFMNSIDWMAGQQQQITIRPKQFIAQRVFLQPRDARVIFTVTIILLPVGMFALGFLTWLQRRSR